MEPTLADCLDAVCECPDCAAQVAVWDGDHTPERCRDCGAFYEPKAVILEARFNGRDMDRVKALRQLGHYGLARMCERALKQKLAQTVKELQS